MNPIISQGDIVTATASVPVIGYDLLTPLLRWLFGEGGVANFGASTLFSLLTTVWVVYAVLAYLAAGLFLYLFIYATVRKGQLDELQDELLKKGEELYDEQYRTGPKNDRLADITQHIASDNPNDWKLAIIEADIILDDTLKRAGYVGVSLGERLRSISPAQLRTLDDAWQAHKVRNQIAHGADFVLTKRTAEDTIKQYRRVFEELGIS